LRNEKDYVLKRAPLSLEILLIGKRNGQLVMIHTGYRRRSSVLEPMARTEVKSGSALYSIARDIPRFVKQNPHWFRPPYARAAERLVEADMASGWVDVGPPTSVLQVDPSGAKVVQTGTLSPD
jgi:hypothetical protein